MSSDEFNTWQQRVSSPARQRPRRYRRTFYSDQWSSQKRYQAKASSRGVVHALAMSVSHKMDGLEISKYLSKLLKTKSNREQLIRDQNDICITSNPLFENGKVCLDVNCGEKKTAINLKVENIGTEPVYFSRCIKLHWRKCFTLTETDSNNLLLQPGDSYAIQVNFHSSLFGTYTAALAFEFKPDLQPSSTAFYIVRFIEAQYVNDLGRELAPTAPYKRKSLIAKAPKDDVKIVDGGPPESLAKMNTEVVLKTYPMAPDFDQFIDELMHSNFFSDRSSGGKFKRFRAALKGCEEDPKSLRWNTYQKKFGLLLHFEEHQMEAEIRKYNIPNSEREEATMTRDPSGEYLILKVPGVSENRPSVLRGDRLHVRPVREKKKRYVGHVHRVQLDSLVLGFHPELLNRFTDDMKFEVEFILGRLTYRLQHRAVELAVERGLHRVLFPPEPTVFPEHTEAVKLSWFDKDLEGNREQRQAVQHIVSGSSKPAPYVLFGPPGTGKTVTLVESIKQIERARPVSHILACAHTNSATDLLCLKLLLERDDIDKRQVYRMYAISQDERHIHEKIKPYSNLKEGRCVFPTKEKLMKYKIIVTTLYTAARLVTIGIPEGHFTHVFVDEAGYAVEPECLIPLAGLLCPKSGQVVLAGDPKQLGPIVRSPLAEKYGMGMSLLERLMADYPQYKKNKEGKYDSRFITKLVHNYRSHDEILEIPRRLFYDNDLKSKVSHNDYCNWKHLPKMDFPLIFHNVMGVDQREASSPSFFNVPEVLELMAYVEKLLQTGTSPSDIGIITPYRKQVQKIRKALEKVKNSESLRVGSVEEFQGEERKVILVSTVRSSPSYITLDKEFDLGFVMNEKRFNVAVTRAQALLIVVGNARMLITDKSCPWAKFIAYCQQRGGYVHHPDEEDFVRNFGQLSIDHDAQG